MRRISKNTNPTHPGVKLLAGKKMPTKAADANKAWSNFKGAKKLLEHLLDEQFHLCCYSEIRADLLGLGHHNEHVKPKSKFPKQTFDYGNLAASALASDPDLQTFGKDKTHESFGGAYKEDNWDAKFISPHQKGVSKFFVFDKNGNINPPKTGLKASEREQAEYTIELLNLRCTYLVDARRIWWEELEQKLEQAQKKGNDEVSKLIASYLTPRDGKLYPFFSLTRQFFGAAAEQYLTEHAPHLL